MEIYSVGSQPQNPDLRNNPENFHPCDIQIMLVIL